MLNASNVHTYAHRSYLCTIECGSLSLLNDVGALQKSVPEVDDLLPRLVRVRGCICLFHPGFVRFSYEDPARLWVGLRMIRVVHFQGRGLSKCRRRPGRFDPKDLGLQDASSNDGRGNYLFLSLSLHMRVYIHIHICIYTHV